MGNLLEKLNEAFKAITVTTLGESVLAIEKFNQFIRVMQEQTKILSEARYLKMESRITDIDRIGFVGRILKSGGTVTAGAQAASDLDIDTDASNPVFNTNQLVARELQAVAGIKDQALRRNIEGEGFSNTLVTLFGEAAGRDLEEFATFADTDILQATDAVLGLTDGWAKLAGNKVYSGSDSVSGEFDTTADNYPENLFDSMIQALPKKYLQDRSAWRFHVSFEVEDAYRNLLRARGTALGDSAQAGFAPLVYKGIPVVYVPLIERAQTYSAITNTPGDIAMLQNPDNMAWGVFHEVTVEPQRSAVGRRTDYVLTIEADAGYEDEDAAVVAFIDQTTP